MSGLRKSARLSTIAQVLDQNSKHTSNVRKRSRKLSQSNGLKESDENSKINNFQGDIVESDHEFQVERISNVVSPLKQKKLNEEKNEAVSPKTQALFTKLSLLSPTNNKFQSSKCASSDGIPSFNGDIYQIAKRALHSTTPECMTSRQVELEELESFIKTHMKNKTSASLYISGPPGTGKTASLTFILDRADVFKNINKVYVNCTSIKSSGAVYGRIMKELGLKINSGSEKDYLNIIEDRFSKTKKTHLLVLDEMDQLDSKNQAILYTIFEWPAKFRNNIILIGIANALDLTDRLLPRLQARCELRPKLLHYAPYSKQQLLEIITSRLEQADALKVFSSAALQMVAAKVAAVSGDVRRALDISRRVIDMIEKDAKNDALQSIENLNVDQFSCNKKVDLKEVIGVLNKVYGTSQNLSDDCDSSFPLQQKIALCSLLLILKKVKNKDITVGKLHDVYKKVCGKLNLFSVDQAEFVGLCSLIETKGIIRVSGRKEPRLHKVTLEWDQEEVLDALKDKVLISRILQDDSFIVKI
ncbi:hypothetical protein WA026_007978 [Henosepilachna vigintioctopunctata]|uniref:Cell division control protein n=1 Tax=Henosepilachna vigintioctopunctata TaxID=420089 RepID=A0AAW1TPU1_9CUCU